MEATTGQKYNGPAITTNSIGKALEVISTTLQLALLIYSFQFRSACLPQWPACRNCGMFILISLLAKNKVTIHPGFSRTVPFKDVSRKKITVLPGHPCPIFGLVSRVYLNTDKLHYFTVWIPILTYWSPKSERLKCICEKIAGGRGSAQTPLGELMMLLQAPKFGLPMARECGACILWLSSQIVVPKLWSPEPKRNIFLLRLLTLTSIYEPDPRVKLNHHAKPFWKLLWTHRHMHTADQLLYTATKWLVKVRWPIPHHNATMAFKKVNGNCKCTCV